MYTGSTIKRLNAQLFKLACELSFKLNGNAHSGVNADGVCFITVTTCTDEHHFEGSYSLVTKSVKARIAN